MNNDLLTIGEAADFLDVSIGTLRRWDRYGKLPAVRLGGERGHRYYRRRDLELFASNLLRLALDWAALGTEVPHGFYCPDAATFQARLVKMERLMMSQPATAASFSLIVLMAGEIGNNSFDHNLGNWPDVPGIFFAYDLNRRIVVLADRGLGILETLRRVVPLLRTHAEALKMAFTEYISGRRPERRGNGLKLVKDVVAENDFRLLFQTGDAELKQAPREPEITISHSPSRIRGCLAMISF